MTATTEDGPEIELCWMVAPVTAVEDFLKRHGENDYNFGFNSDGETTLYIREDRVADWEDVLVWRRGGKVIAAQNHEVPYIEGHAVMLGLVPRKEHGGRVVAYWPTDRTVVADAAPIESKTAALQWMGRHPVEGMRRFDRKDKNGTKRPIIRTPDGKEYPKWYWLVWTEERGVMEPMTTAAWRAVRGSLIKDGISFRQMFEGSELGFKRKNTGVN